MTVFLYRSQNVRSLISSPTYFDLLECSSAKGCKKSVTGRLPISDGALLDMFAGVKLRRGARRADR